MICDTCKFLIDSVDEVGTPKGSFPVHTRRCKKHETCGGEWCDKYERGEAVWALKGMYGNGTPFAPLMDLYECSNCKALSVEQFDECPECHFNMTKEGETE